MMRLGRSRLRLGVGVVEQTQRYDLGVVMARERAAKTRKSARKAVRRCARWLAVRRAWWDDGAVMRTREDDGVVVKLLP